MADRVSRYGFPIIPSSCERGFLRFNIYILLYFLLLRERVFWVLFFMFEILFYIFPAFPL